MNSSTHRVRQAVSIPTLYPYFQATLREVIHAQTLLIIYVARLLDVRPWLEAIGKPLPR
jgi:hypothetical protein